MLPLLLFYQLLFFLLLSSSIVKHARKNCKTCVKHLAPLASFLSYNHFI